ncbi:torsin-1A-like [Ornithodoros turicata]|uniref:torsin-1A-like n=1 Tax=Ornithodoros turicata TaxID=34597 RepID=UPI0031398F2F
MQLRSKTVCYIFIGLLLNLHFCNAIEPVTVIFGIAAIGVSVLYAKWQAVQCTYECCATPWVKDNIKGLENTMRTRLHGQPLVHQTVISAIKEHLRNPNPRKALVLSFHGWTGGGKTYASTMIADALYENGMDSKFVRLYVSTKHFPHQDEVPKYKKQLHQEIEGKVRECARALFIFDEIDEMPNGLIDIIKPYLDFYKALDGVDYRKAIFIFLSNTAGDVIARSLLSAWKNGIDRNKIRLSEMEKLVGLGSFNEKGGLYRADIVEKNLIDVFVPFLPLERKQIIACIEDEFKRRGIKMPPKRELEEMADDLDYIPSEYNLYSSTGCKKVHQKVTQHLGFREEI